MNRNAYAASPSGLNMDNLTYSYNTGTNKLNHVNDAIAGANYNYEISNTQLQDNYEYDGNGALIADKSKNQYFDYNSRGLVTGIYNDAGKTSPKVLYTYDEKGSRLKKTSYTPTGSGTLIKDTWYINEVSGKLISIYERDNVLNTLNQKETYVNGLGKIATCDKTTNNFIYELTDHLGNIRTTFSKAGINNICTSFDNNGQWDYLFDYYNNQIDNTVDVSGGSGSSCLTEYPSKQYGHTLRLKVYPGQQIDASVYTYYNSVNTPNTYLAFGLTDKYGNIVDWYSPPVAGTSNLWNQFNFTYIVPSAYGNDLSLGIFPFNVDASGIQVWYDNLCVNAMNMGGLSSLYAPSVLNTTDYYPHGGILPGRNYISSINNRFNFQGKEKDQETGLSSFNFRLWDDQLGRWQSPDPANQYSSPYIGMGNNPILNIDKNGLWTTDGKVLYAEKGDNAFSLYQYYNQYYPGQMSYEHAQLYFNNINNWDGGKSSSGIGEVQGHYLTLNPIQRTRYVNVAEVNARSGNLYNMPYIPNAYQQATYDLADNAGYFVAGAATAIAAAPLLIEAAPLVAAEGSMIYNYGGSALKATIAGSGMWSTSEVLWSSKIGGALADATTQMIGDEPYNVSSTLLELNPASNPITSAVIQGYGAEFFKFQGTTYTGVGTSGFDAKNAVNQGTYNTGANIIGDYPGGKFEQYNLGPSFDFLNSYMWNSGANVVTPQYSGETSNSGSSTNNTSGSTTNTTGP